MNIKKIIDFKWFYNNWFFVFIFCFFLYINFLSPPVGDDWEVATWFSVSAKGNILTLIKSIYWNWKNFNGRGLSLLITSYFCYFKTLWNFVSAGMFTYIVYFFSTKDKKINNKIIPALLFFFLLSVSDNIRMEVYSLVCANTGFVVPLIFILTYLKIIKKDLESLDSNKKYPLKFLFLISIFCLIIATLMENISAGFTLTLGLINVYVLLKNRQINQLFLTSFFFSLIGSIFMFTSPGMHAGREVYNSSLGLFGTFQQSLSQNIRLIIIENSLIFFIITLINLIAIITNSVISKKSIKISYLIFNFTALIILLLFMSNGHFPIPQFLHQLSNIFFGNNFIVSIFWLIFLILLIIPIAKIKTDRNLYVFLYFIAIFSLLPASLITQTGARIVSISLFILIGLSCKVLEQVHLKYSKILYWIILFGIFVQINRLFVIYLNIYKIQKTRQSIIDNTLILQHQGLWNYNKQLILPSFPENSLYHTANPSPDNIYHYNNFIEYTQLDPKTKVIFR